MYLRLTTLCHLHGVNCAHLGTILSFRRENPVIIVKLEKIVWYPCLDRLRKRKCETSKRTAKWTRNDFCLKQILFLLTRANVERSIYQGFTDSIKFLVFYYLRMPLIIWAICLEIWYSGLKFYTWQRDHFNYFLLYKKKSIKCIFLCYIIFSLSLSLNIFLYTNIIIDRETERNKREREKLL